MGDERKKRPRNGPDARSDLKRVSEIVMLLSAMAEMRGGCDPTALEKELAAEARELVGGMCEELKPKDLFSRDAVMVVVDDLGLNRSMDTVTGFRPPKISIADKLLITKKRMEESKEFTSLHSAQPPVGFDANSDSNGTLFNGAPRFLPDRSTPVSLSTGGYQSASPVVHVPNLSSATTSIKQSHIYGIQPTAALIKPSTIPFVKDPPSLTLSHTKAEHFRFDVPSSGSSYLTQVRGEYAPIKSSSSSGQSTSVVTNYEGICDTFQPSDQVTISQGMETSVIQAMPGNLLVGHQSSQALTYVHATSYVTNHNDIANSVQLVLHQKVSDRSNWTLPSTDYMNKPLNCQFCKITINDGESLLVCDACEKGTHLKCLQSFPNKSIPKTDWHCQRCLMASNGKPFPPKYGKVTRSIATSKASSNTLGSYVSPEKRAENPDTKVNKESVPNGNSALPHLVYASNVVSNHSESASDSKATSAREMEDVDFLSAGMKREDGVCTGISTYPAKERDGMICAAPLDMQRSTPKSTLEPNIASEKACSNNQNKISEDNFQSPGDLRACNSTKVSASVEISENKLRDISDRSTTDGLKLCELGEIPANEDDCDIRLHDLEHPEATPSGASDKGDAAVECGRLLPLDLHTVDWVGDILEVIEEKIYYMSCRIRGSLHKLQDHVLVSSNSQSLLPSKLQSLWEDKQTGSKWATVDLYYFPGDLPEYVNRPSTPEMREVYASGKRSTIMVGSISGPCEVLPIDKFSEESDRTHLGDTNSELHQIFMCRWLYDESKGVFQSITN